MQETPKSHIFRRNFFFFHISCFFWAQECGPPRI